MKGGNSGSFGVQGCLCYLIELPFSFFRLQVSSAVVVQLPEIYIAISWVLNEHWQEPVWQYRPWSRKRASLHQHATAIAVAYGFELYMATEHCGRIAIEEFVMSFTLW